MRGANRDEIPAFPAGIDGGPLDASNLFAIGHGVDITLAMTDRESSFQTIRQCDEVGSGQSADRRHHSGRDRRCPVQRFPQHAEDGQGRQLRLAGQRSRPVLENPRQVLSSEAEQRRRLPVPGIKPVGQESLERRSFGDRKIGNVHRLQLIRRPPIAGPPCVVAAPGM